MAGKPSNPNIERPDRLCFVDKPCSQKAVLQRYVTAQAMFIPMIKYDPNNIERSGTMYVIDEFENNPEIHEFHWKFLKRYQTYGYMGYQL